LSAVGEDTIYVDEIKRIAINEEIYTDENLVKLGLNKDELVQKKGVEVGNTFHLETKYTDALGLYYKDENGEKQSIIMGCYGIGVSRIMGVIAELFADDKGLVWPETVAPFQVHLLSLNQNEKANEIYVALTQSGMEVLFDDRDTNPGGKFADADLIGLPFQVIVSEKNVRDNRVEVKNRKSGAVEYLSLDSAEIIKYFQTK